MGATRDARTERACPYRPKDSWRCFLRNPLAILDGFALLLPLVQDVHEGWGEAIKERLAELEYSQNWLARAIDKDPGTVSRIVAGKLNPSDEIKWLIAGALRMRMDRLWEWPRIIPPFPGDDQPLRQAS